MCVVKTNEIYIRYAFSGDAHAKMRLLPFPKNPSLSRPSVSIVGPSCLSSYAVLNIPYEKH